MPNDRETLQEALELYGLEGVHEAANIFPLMSDDEYADFVADIKNGGFTTPVKVTDDLIVIDGRNRLCASIDIGLDVSIRKFNPVNVLNYVLSENLYRRHLTTPQKAAVAVEIKEKFAEEAKERQIKAGEIYGRGQEKKLVANLPQAFKEDNQKSLDNKSRKKASKVVNVGERSIQKAEKVKKIDPDLYEKMKEGKVKSVDSAYRSAVDVEDKFKDSGEVINTSSEVSKKNSITCVAHNGNKYEVNLSNKQHFNRTNDSIQWAVL